MADDVIPREKRVSHSEADYFLQCRRKHFYGYILNIRKRSSSIALHRGNVGHEIMDEFFKSIMAGDLEPDSYKEYLDESAKLYLTDGTIDAETFLLYRKQFEAFAKEYPFADWQILGVEKRLVAKISEDLYFPYIVDLIARDTFGNVVVIDHKFTKDFYKPWNLEINPQIVKYVAANRHEGLPSDTGAYSIFRTGFAQKSESDNIYKLQPVEISDKRVEKVWVEQINVSEQIQAIKEEYSRDPDLVDEHSYRSVNNMICNSCPFKSICVADLNGWARKPLLKTEYEIKEEGEFTYEQAD